jgi:murein DD-endopeptidase MepM/ murein hydrolase activator NlpD
MAKFTSKPINIELKLRTAGLASVRSAMFGMVRNGGTRAHQGIDIAVEPNFRIRAVENGRVVTAVNTDNSDHGLHVCLQLDCPHKPALHGLFAFYSHLSRVDVKVGQQVKAGDILGLTGHSGNASTMRTVATGAHLHFELRTTRLAGLGLANRVDPLQFIDLDK